MGRHEARISGISILPDISYGTHICLFYRTKQDLIDILIPYFKAGLENNEFCMWVTSEPLKARDAESELRAIVRNLDDYIEKGQIEFLDCNQRYTQSGRFNADEVLQGWVEKEKQALSRGFAGLRLTGNTFLVKDDEWKEFTDYEETVDSDIKGHKMIAVCAYSLEKCGATEFIDVVNNHQSTLIKREGEWEIFGSAAHKLAKNENKLLQQQLFQAQKMESIGQLAAGMAHDFNNMLAVIMGNANLAMFELKSNDPGFTEFKEIVNASERAKDLTMKLLTFSRHEKVNVISTAVSGIIGDLTGILKRSFPKKIEIKTLFEESLPPVNVDENQIHQSLLNICNNARDAMPSGGTLTIDCRKEVLDDEYCGEHIDVKPGCYCLIQIGDTGIGMSKEIITRAIEPFFTTKGVGKGTGLGLSTTYGIIKNHGGHIRIHSEKGQGTVIKVYLPFAGEGITEREKAAPEVIKKGTGTILIVDDEKSVLELMGRVLKNAGYKSIITDNGKEAIEIYSMRHKEIDLVLLDMIMPKMDGQDVFKAIKEINPNANVLISSGYSITDQAGDLLANGAVGFIQKPFSIEELCNKVWEALDGR